MRLLKAGKDQQAQRLATGFVDPLGVVTNGGIAQLNLKVTPGWYVLACFMDTQDHREHTQLGMVRLVRVTE